MLAPRILAAAALAAAGAAHAGCELVLSEHRAERVLARWTLPAPVQFSVRFTHSVLRTEVQDTYQMRPHGSGWRAHLVEERFHGEGYGLPHVAAGEKESLQRTASGWLLRLDRAVDPLVVRPTPEQDPWLQVGDQSVRLATLGRGPMEISARGCKRSLQAETNDNNT